jgi:hypothetical protein
MARTLEMVDDLEKVEALEGLVERVKDGRYIAEAIVLWWGLDWGWVRRRMFLWEKVGLELEGFDEVEDSMFWLLFFVVEGLMETIWDRDRRIYLYLRDYREYSPWSLWWPWWTAVLASTPQLWIVAELTQDKTTKSSVRPQAQHWRGSSGLEKLFLRPILNIGVEISWSILGNWGVPQSQR